MVSFPDAVKMFFSRYVDFQGRSRRSEYWWVMLFHTIVYFALSILAGIFGAIGGSNGEPGPLFWVFMGLLGIYVLIIFIPNLALTVRRIHDVNITGWLLIGAFIPFVGFLVAIGIFVISVLPGTVGPNKYGSDPKNPTAGAADTFV